MKQYQFTGGVFAMGDVHGNYKTVNDYIARILPENSALIQVGDWGMGFANKNFQLRELEQINNLCKGRKITLLVIRGNHDKKTDWEDPDYQGFSNIEFIKDYERRRINGFNFLFIGGAISVDRAKRTINLDWFPDEPLTLQKINNGDEVDVLITHTANRNLVGDLKGDIVGYFAPIDPSLRNDLKIEHERFDKILTQLTSLQCHFFGHYHKYNFIQRGKCQHVCLNIDEVAQIPLDRLKSRW